MEKKNGEKLEILLPYSLGILFAILLFLAGSEGSFSV